MLQICHKVHLHLLSNQGGQCKGMRWLPYTNSKPSPVSMSHPRESVTEADQDGGGRTHGQTSTGSVGCPTPVSLTQLQICISYFACAGLSSSTGMGTMRHKVRGINSPRMHSKLCINQLQCCTGYGTGETASLLFQHRLGYGFSLFTNVYPIYLSSRHSKRLPTHL